MILLKGISLLTVILGLSSAMAAPTFNAEDPNLAPHYDGASVAYVSNGATGANATKNPNDCDCNRSNAEIRSNTVATPGSNGNGGDSNAKGIDN